MALTSAVRAGFLSSRSCLLGRVKLETANLNKSIRIPVRNINISAAQALGRHRCLPVSWNPSPTINSYSRIFHCPSLLLPRCLPINPLPLSPVPCVLHLQPARSIVKVSKRKGKRKTVKAVAKRFYRTGSGKLKYWPAGKVHNMLSKSNKRRRQLRKARYATKTQMKTLNKMLAGW
jgi:large subunit ribosomal protein L35